MSWLRFWWLGIVIVFIVLAVQRFPHEIKQWQLAWAAEQQLNGNGSAALRQMQQLAAEDPANLDLQLAHLGTMVDNGVAAEAIATARSIMANDELKPSQRRRLASQLHRLHLHDLAFEQLQRALGDLEKSLQPKPTEQDQDAEKVPTKPRELSAYDRLVWTNALAYAAYLSGQDLDVHFREINATLRQTGLEDQFAIYRSQALRVVGRSDEGLRYLKAAVRRLEQRLEEENQQLSDRLGSWMSQETWPETEEPITIRQSRSNVLEIQSMLQLLYSQAAVLSDDLGDDQSRKTFNNKAIVASIGMEQPPLDLSPQVVAQQLIYIASMLDTRGALATKTRRWKQAQADLDAAIQAAYLARAITLDTGLANSPAVVDERDIRDQELANDEALAVFHYHRALLATALKDPAAEARDQAAVRSLGHEPGPQLH